MAFKETPLKFNFGYGELLGLTIEKLAFLTRDIVELIPRGISNQRLIDFGILKNNFQNTEEDGILLQEYSSTATKKDEIRNDLQIKAGEVIDCAALALAINTADYRSFQSDKLLLLNDPTFYVRIDWICDRADFFQAALALKGIQAADVLAIRNLNALFYASLKDVNQAQVNRFMATEKRRLEANKLYDELIDLCETAKVYFKNRDEALYNDYVIYQASKTAQIRTGKLAPGEIKTRTWHSLKASVNMLAQNDSEGELQIYFANKPNGEPASKHATLAAKQHATYNIATQLGYKKSAGATHFVMKNSSTQEVVYKIKIA